MTLTAWRPGLTTLWAILLALTLVSAIAPMDIEAQALFAYGFLALVLVLRRLSGDRPDDVAGSLVMLFGTFISIRYIAWRFGYTLWGSDPLSFVAGMALFLAEVYSLFIHLTGIFVNFSPLNRRVRRLDPAGAVPTVDVLIPSYNEEPELLEVTIRACKMMRYPVGRKRIYLLDDGGTDQKCNDKDPDKAAAARQRRQDLIALCARLEIGYITRARNEHAKAGNVNSALSHTDGELVLILDADHVPTVDLLERAIPYFVDHPGVFLVQTPHFMINPDPIDRNLLSAFRRMPAENEMFYVTIQRGLDYWDSSFFCGSAAILRRAHLDMVGGLSGDSITEDAETALGLHAKGLHSVYVDHPMVAGLAPETFTGFISQRMRWTQGMVQILLLKRPWRMPGLRWYQRLGYISSASFWFFPLARLTFLIAPTAYLVFGLDIYNASVPEILVYTIPHVVASLTITYLLFQRTRWPLISELYETMQSVFAIKALYQVFRNPRNPQFVVTPKGETLQSEFISPMATPFYLLFLVVLAGTIGGVVKLWLEPGARALTAVVLFWEVINLVLVVASFGALLERRQRRSTPRMPVELSGVLVVDGTPMPCRIEDLSIGGARLVFDNPDLTLPADAEGVLEVAVPALDKVARLNLVVRARFQRHGRQFAGVMFQPQSDTEYDDAVALMYGNSDAWARFQARRTRPMPFFRALGVMIRLAYHPVVEHFGLIWRHRVRKWQQRRAAEVER